MLDMLQARVYEKAFEKGFVEGVEIGVRIAKYLEVHPTASNAAVAEATHCTEKEVALFRK